ARIQRAACWAHARRKFDECRANHSQHCTAVLAMIRELFDLETRAKRWTTEQRLELRRTESTRILQSLREYLDGPATERLLPKSDLAEAVNYVKNNWEALSLFTVDGRAVR
ncbi:MAG: transposase, partial [Planctomycetales bacterium]|nr:transposase [Planctomycetales bacterium]